MDLAKLTKKKKIDDLGKQESGVTVFSRQYIR